MPYLDGSPLPEDGKIEQAVSIKIAMDEPEVMIAALLTAIYRINGRRVDSINIDWVDRTAVNSLIPDQQPKTVCIDSTMFHNFEEGGYQIG